MYKLIFPGLLCIAFYSSHGQLDNIALHSFLQQENDQSVAGPVKRFYQANDYTPVWFSAKGTVNRNDLLSIIATNTTVIFDKRTNLYTYLNSLNTENQVTRSQQDSLFAETAFTEVLLSYIHAMAGLTSQPSFSYEGLPAKDITDSIDALAGKFLLHKTIPQLVQHIQPGLKEVTALESRLALLIKRQQTTIREEKVKSSIANSLNTALIKKLYLLGIVDSMAPVSNNLMKGYIKTAQEMFNLLNDGILRSTFLEELNVSAGERIRRLRLSLDYYRWLHTISSHEPVIVVNICAASLTVYESDTARLSMRMIVGKPATPTPTLTSRVTDIVFYPYWNVPRNIAVNEMLPSIRRSRQYIDANNLQVLDKNGRILDPAAINWAGLNAANFPYRLRQSTGCDNALGILKVEFYNPFSVYLHDTPVKSLFMLNKRYFSHGCMRMEQPVDLVRLLLNNQWPASLDTSVCLEDQKPVIIPAAVRMPVIVTYNPAGLDSHGNVVFYEDVYKKWKDQ